MLGNERGESLAEGSGHRIDRGSTPDAPKSPPLSRYVSAGVTPAAARTRAVAAFVREWMLPETEFLAQRVERGIGNTELQEEAVFAAP